MLERPMTPRMKLAARLYATAAAPTKAAAADAAGLSRSYFYVQSAPGAETRNPLVQDHIDEIDAKMMDRSIQTSILLEHVGREALVEMRNMMRAESTNIAIKFKAAQDLLDRSPETSKVQKHLVAGFSLDSADAKELASAMVHAAHIRKENIHLAEGDIIRIPVDPILDQGDMPDAGQGLLTTSLRQEHQRGDLSSEGHGDETERGTSDLYPSQEGERPATENAA